jgi:hypothetical protein
MEILSYGGFKHKGLVISASKQMRSFLASHKLAMDLVFRQTQELWRP